MMQRPPPPTGYELDVLADLASYERGQQHVAPGAARASSYWAPPAFEAHQGHHHHHQHPQRHDPLPAMQAPPYHGSPSSSPPPPPRGPPFMNAYPPQQYATSVTSSGSEPQHSHDEADLKRLRNTAASARFRAKKKAREQSLERNAQEKREKLRVLEGRVRELETENAWLRDLIMDVRGVREKKKDDGEGERGKDGDGKEAAEGDGERGRKQERDGVGVDGT
ncbi:hypothetical protein M430DRAFT_17389 [Amorphotheca resinae ATCC 22711]|uniref:BZIP domain-containing protein n=1 Tax=Amorphotheca resinae ATCC 22711 TaxID=857342 RepID=A0A2T3B9A5_AMORE|nr:hypothetical protein M430DRAFT_17389 [Amorphotheca resinae ATCC 22711]PSS23469.1 hypothetical protein M430DRAFT_17389 [Amorphotheca resinae ATCC 22711]